MKRNEEKGIKEIGRDERSNKKRNVKKKIKEQLFFY